MRKGISEDKVKRMRNIVSGNYNSKTKIRSGYTAKNIERVDRLIKLIAIQMGEDTHLIDPIIEQVDRRLEINRGS